MKTKEEINVKVISFKKKHKKGDKMVFSYRPF